MDLQLLKIGGAPITVEVLEMLQFGGNGECHRQQGKLYDVYALGLQHYAATDTRPQVRLIPDL